MKKKKVHYRQVSIEFFIRIRDCLPQNHKLFLTLHTKEQYEEMGILTYLSSTQKSGYGLDREGNLISLFSLPQAEEGIEAVEDAISNGACQLDCIGKKLANFYKEYFGFEEYRREKWVDKFAPPGWDIKRFGKPDIFYLRLKK